MEHRAAILRITAVVLSLWTAAVAAGDPPPIKDLSSATSLSADDRNRVAVYAEFWAERLMMAAENPSEVQNIRRKLSDPLDRGLITEVFRTYYGTALKGGLEQVLAEGNPHTSVVAMIVLSRVGTESALMSLLDHCGLPDEPRRHVRLAAARGCRQMLASDLLDSVKPNKITGAARTLANAAQRETDRFTLRHQLEAIFFADRTVLADGPRAQIHSSLVSALDGTASRASMAQADASPNALELLDATYPVLYLLRNAFLDPQNLPPVLQREFGRKLGPCLGRMFDVARKHWGDVQSAPREKDQYWRIIYLCENFLSTIDPFVRPNQQGSLSTQLATSWKDGDADRFSRDLKRWQDVLERPPY